MALKAMQFPVMPAPIFARIGHVTIKWKDAPRRQERRRPNADQKRALKAAGLRVFVRQYGRKAQKRTEPNDRRYDADVERVVKRMDPATLDRLLRDDEED
ncbi:MAG TPA: hypothetical protein VJ790_02160 [Dongiaceae bacterium]|nr:hypothetical protein [Dongiaceae bacterium]